ncbi:MAG: RNA polymerase sigma factor [Deltaproteobacteria bacterium]|nr:RNA polymerase sigma factor [Deltaproteobacteria bacterium]
MDLDEDVKLMLAFQQGDERSFDTLYRRHAQALARYFWRSTFSTSLSEELVQETFLKIHRYKAGYQPRAGFRTYLYLVARSILLNHWKVVQAARLELELDAEALEAERDDVDLEVARREELRRVQAALRNLPERQASALLLVRGEGLSYEEAAQAMEMSVPALKSLLNRARQQLAEQVVP